MYLHCALSCGAVYCNRSFCLFVCLCVCASVTTITRNCMHRPHQTGFIGKGSDHLQLNKFWPSCAPREGGLQRGGIFWLRLTTASARCLRLLRAIFSLYFVFEILLKSILRSTGDTLLHTHVRANRTKVKARNYTEVYSHSLNLDDRAKDCRSFPATSMFVQRFWSILLSAFAPVDELNAYSALPV